MKNYFCDDKRIDPRPIRADMTLAELIDTTFLAYNAGRLREACRLFAEKICSDDVLIGMSLSGALTPAGIGVSCIVPLIRHGLVDWIVSTGANLYHDLHFSLAKPLYSGSPHYDDTDLKKHGVIRIYDIVFDYDVLLSTDAFIRKVVSADEFQKEMGTAELHYHIGKYAAARERELGVQQKSVLSTAFEYDVPVYTSSPADSSIGMNIAAGALRRCGPRVDTIRDINETAAYVYAAKRSGGRSAVVIFGGGSPKNFMLQTEPHIQEVLGLKEAGHDYFIQVTDARPDTGGLSGATPSEAVSWGKIDPQALPNTVVVYADAALVIPLLTAYVLAHDIRRTPQKLYSRRDDVLERMLKDLRGNTAQEDVC